MLNKIIMTLDSIVSNPLRKQMFHQDYAICIISKLEKSLDKIIIYRWSGCQIMNTNSYVKRREHWRVYRCELQKNPASHSITAGAKIVFSCRGAMTSTVNLHWDETSYNTLKKFLKLHITHWKNCCTENYVLKLVRDSSVRGFF